MKMYLNDAIPFWRLHGLLDGNDAFARKEAPIDLLQMDCRYRRLERKAYINRRPIALRFLAATIVVETEEMSCELKKARLLYRYLRNSSGLYKIVSHMLQLA